MSILCDVFNDNFDFRANIFKEFDITRKDDEQIETDASIESIIGVIDELKTNFENVICEHSVQALKYMLKFKTNADYNIVEGEVNQALLKQADEMTSLKYGKMQPAYYPEGGRREIRRQKNKTAKQARKMGGLEKIEIDESGGRRGVMRNYVPEGVLNQYSDKGRCKTYIYVAADNKEKEELEEKKNPSMSTRSGVVSSVAESSPFLLSPLNLPSPVVGTTQMSSSSGDGLGGCRWAQSVSRDVNHLLVPETRQPLSVIMPPPRFFASSSSSTLCHLFL